MTRARNCFLAVAIAAVGLACGSDGGSSSGTGGSGGPGSGGSGGSGGSHGEAGASGARRRERGRRRERPGGSRGRRGRWHRWPCRSWRRRGPRRTGAARALVLAAVAMPAAGARRDPGAAQALVGRGGDAGAGGGSGEGPRGIRGGAGARAGAGDCRRGRQCVWGHRRRDLPPRTVLRLRQRPVWRRRPAGAVRVVGWWSLPTTDCLRLRRAHLLQRLRSVRQRRRHDEHDLVHSRQRRHRRPLRRRQRLHDRLQVLRHRRDGRVAHRLSADSRRRVMPVAALRRAQREQLRPPPRRSARSGRRQ